MKKTMSLSGILSAKKRKRNQKRATDEFEVDKALDELLAPQASDTNTQSPDLDENPLILQNMISDTTHLCTQLNRSTETFKPEEWMDELKKYLDRYHRLLYSSISNYIFGLHSNKNIDILSSNFDKVVSYVMRHEVATENDGSVKFSPEGITALKFYDHINLAKHQFNLISEKEGQVEVIIDRKLEPALAQSAKELTSQLVGLVAIFTALSFIVFGGITSLDNIMVALSNRDFAVLPVLIVTLAWGFCVVNLLFAFMYFTLRIVGFTSKDDPPPKKNIVKRHPLFFLSNYLILSALLICIGAWSAKQTGVGSEVYDCALTHNTRTFWFFFFVIAGVIAIGAYILWRMYRGEESTK